MLPTKSGLISPSTPNRNRRCVNLGMLWWLGRQIWSLLRVQLLLLQLFTLLPFYWSRPKTGIGLLILMLGIILSFHKMVCFLFYLFVFAYNLGLHFWLIMELRLVFQGWMICTACEKLCWSLNWTWSVNVSSLCCLHILASNYHYLLSFHGGWQFGSFSKCYLLVEMEMGSCDSYLRKGEMQKCEFHCLESMEVSTITS